jgi:hypothetical protein
VAVKITTSLPPLVVFTSILDEIVEDKRSDVCCGFVLGLSNHDVFK